MIKSSHPQASVSVQEGSTLKLKMALEMQRGEEKVMHVQSGILSMAATIGCWKTLRPV